MDEKATGGTEACDAFCDSIVARAGKVFALRCMESRRKLGSTAVRADGVALNGVGGAAEAVGEAVREDRRAHDVSTIGNGVEGEARAFLCT